MIELCDRKGVAVAVNCSRRYNVFFTEARRMVDEGELGEILQITAYARCNLSHNGSHAIDAMRYLVGGNVEWVFGEMESDEKAAADEDLMGNGYMAFDNGVRGFSARHADRYCPVGVRRYRHRGSRPLSGARHGDAVLPLGDRRTARPRLAGKGALPIAYHHTQHGTYRDRRPRTLHRDRCATALLGRRRAQSP